VECDELKSNQLSEGIYKMLVSNSRTADGGGYYVQVREKEEEVHDKERSSGVNYPRLKSTKHML